MNFGEWTVKIEWETNSLRRNIFIYCKLPNGEVDVLKKGLDLVERHKFGDSVDPTICIDDDILGMICDSYRGKGWTPKDQSKSEGMLESTKYHLEDLRKLLKLKD